MNTLTRSIFFTAMAAVGLTQGCSCSDDDDPAPVVITPPDPADPVVTTVSGTAAKGLVLGGIVNIHPIINNVISVNPLQDGDGNVIQGTTNESGNYSIDIDDYSGNPFVVRVSAGDSTMMRCDLSGGCGNDGDGSPINFGDDFSVTNDFQLDAVVDTTLATQNTNIPVNLNVFTNAAANVVRTVLEAGGSADTVGQLIANSNSAIANRFNLPGDITQLPVVDLTNPQAVADADPDDVLANSYGPAIVQALRSDNNTLSIDSAIARFAETFADNGLSDRTSTPELTGLNEILAQAQQVINTVKDAATTGGVTLNLGTLETALENEITFTDSQPPSDTGSQGTPGETSASSELEKARALVAVISDLGANMDMAAIVEGVTLGAKADELKMQLEAAEMASSDGVEQVLEATAMTVSAIAGAAADYEDGLWTAGEGGVWSAWTSDDGIEVMISIAMNAETQAVESVSYMVGSAEQAATVSVDIDGVASDVAVYMTAVDTVETSDSVSSEGAEVSTAMGGVSLMGTAEVADLVKLTVKDGSSVSLGSGEAVETQGDNGSTTVVTVTDINLSLMAMIEQTDPAVTDPITFDGHITAEIEAINATETETWTDLGESSATEEEVTVIELSVGGTVSNLTDSATLALTVKGDGTGIDFAQTWLDGELMTDIDSETLDNYAAASVSIMLSADLAGVSDAVTLSFTVARTAESTASAAIKVAYPGVSLNLSTKLVEDATTQKVILRNQDGVVMTIVDSDTADEITGTIFVGTKKLADITGATVRYTETNSEGETILDFLDIFSDEEEGTVTEASAF